VSRPTKDADSSASIDEAQLSPRTLGVVLFVCCVLGILFAIWSASS